MTNNPPAVILSFSRRIWIKNDVIKKWKAGNPDNHLILLIMVHHFCLNHDFPDGRMNRISKSVIKNNCISIKAPYIMAEIHWLAYLQSNPDHALILFNPVQTLVTFSQNG